MARPPSHNSSSDAPETTEGAPPTESFRPAEMPDAPLHAVTSRSLTQRSRPSHDSQLGQPSQLRSDSKQPRSDAAPAALGNEDVPDARPTVLSINTTQRSADEPISQGRIVRDDGRMARLEEQLTLLDARVRLAEKNSEKFRRVAYLALTFLVAGLGYALTH